MKHEDPLIGTWIEKNISTSPATAKEFNSAGVANMTHEETKKELAARGYE